MRRLLPLLPRPLGPVLPVVLVLLALAIGHLPPAAGAVVPPGGAPDLFILFTGDVQGYVEPCG